MKRIFAVLLCLTLILTVSGICCAADEDCDYIIFDCDMGCMGDDALALSLLLGTESSSNFEILGITLEGGNNFIKASYENFGEEQLGSLENTQILLGKCSRTDIPVYAGTDYPAGYGAQNIDEVADRFRNADYIPFNSGWGAIHFFENLSSGQLYDGNEAADFLVSSVKQHPGSVVIFAVGPTMNIARAIGQDETFAENVKAVYYMGGAFGAPYEVQAEDGSTVQVIGGANVTPYAEYNVLYDPVSFYRCITAGFEKQYICPGELTIEINSDIVESLRAANRNNALLANLWLQQYDTYIQDYPYWDPATVYVYLSPDGVTAGSDCYVTVNTDRNDERFGETSAVSAEEYRNLPEADREKYGETVIIEGISGFWDYFSAKVTADTP